MSTNSTTTITAAAMTNFLVPCSMGNLPLPRSLCQVHDWQTALVLKDLALPSISQRQARLAPLSGFVESTPLLRCFHDQRRHGFGHPRMLVNSYKRHICCGRVPPLSGQCILGIDLDAYLYRCAEHSINLRFQVHDFAK